MMAVASKALRWIPPSGLAAGFFFVAHVAGSTRFGPWSPSEPNPARTSSAMTGPTFGAAARVFAASSSRCRPESGTGDSLLLAGIVAVTAPGRPGAGNAGQRFAVYVEKGSCPEMM